MPRRQGVTTSPMPEKWTQTPDGEWVAQGRATIKGRVTYHTRKRRARVGQYKAANKAKKRS